MVRTDYKQATEILDWFHSIKLLDEARNKTITYCSTGVSLVFMKFKMHMLQVKIILNWFDSQFPLPSNSNYS